MRRDYSLRSWVSSRPWVKRNYGRYDESGLKPMAMEKGSFSVDMPLENPLQDSFALETHSREVAEP